MKRTAGHRISVALSWAIYMPIVGLSYLIAWLDRRLRFPLAFPRDVQQLSERKPWLLAELKKNGTIPADAVIDSCEVSPMNQAIIFRSNAGIIDIRYTQGGTQQVLKCFAKFAPTMGSVWNKTIFNLQLNHIKEGWFNQYYVNQNPNVPAPHVYLSKVSVITGNLCLITEHMGDNIEYRECAYESFPQEHLDLAIDGLASLHAEYWGDTSKRMERVLPISDMAVYMFDAMVAGSWSMPAREVLVRSWTLMNQPQTVLHGDSRIGNMMFPKPQPQANSVHPQSGFKPFEGSPKANTQSNSQHPQSGFKPFEDSPKANAQNASRPLGESTPAEARGRYVLIDWQATRRGRGAFDLAYFLILSLISHHRKAVEKASIDTYQRLLIAKGVTNYSRADLEEDYRHGCLCTLVLLALPMLSGEVSVEGMAAQIFVFGMGVWKERMRIHFEDFDYDWMADRYAITVTEARDAVAEMLAVIDRRLAGISEASGSKEPLVDLLKRHGVAHEFDV